MDEKIFGQLKKEYEIMQLGYKKKIDSQRKQAVKRCINKGYLLDVTPFEHELQGYKLQKKELNEVVMRNECFTYYFDNKGRVCLVEEASTFLNRIENYTLYDYYEDYLCKYEFQESGVINVSRFCIENEKIKEGYIYGKFGHEHQLYVYEKEILEKIIYTHFEHQQNICSRWENDLYYKSKKLKLIQQVYSNGYKVNNYADKKINYKKLEESLYGSCRESVKEFMEKHNNVEAIQDMAITLWIDDLNPAFDINYRVAGDKKNSITEWTYSSAASISVSDIPLDSTQQDKLVSIIYGILVRLIDDGMISENMSVKVYYHDEVETSLEKKEIQKIIFGRKQFLE